MFNCEPVRLFGTIKPFTKKVATEKCISTKNHQLKNSEGNSITL